MTDEATGEGEQTARPLAAKVAGAKGALYAKQIHAVVVVNFHARAGACNTPGPSSFSYASSSRNSGAADGGADDTSHASEALSCA